MRKLLDELRELRFTKVYRLPEECHGETRPIRSGEPFTYGRDRGVVVIYDDAGLPWVLKGRHIRRINRRIEALIRSYKLRNGAHVPHLSDISDDHVESRQRLVRRQPAQLQYV